RLRGDAGFTRVVAIKHLHEHVARDPEFAAMLLDEARLVSRIRHPNVVTMLDVVTERDDIYLVMEYVHGEALSGLLSAARRHEEPLPAGVAVAIVRDVLSGLHAAHQAVDAHGMPLGIVHRDVSPHNIVVGADGAARILDFGVAKAVAKLHTTRAGTLKGTLPYMAPENLRGEDATVRSDIHAVGCVLWEALTGERLFKGDSEAVILGRVLEGVRRPPSSVAEHAPPALDAVALRALSRDPSERYEDAGEMARALQAAHSPAAPAEVGAWVQHLAGTSLAARQEKVAWVERGQKWSDAGERPIAEGTRTALPAADTTTVALTTSSAVVRARRAPRGLILAAAFALGGGAFYAMADERTTPLVADVGGFGHTVSLPSAEPVSSPSPAVSTPAVASVVPRARPLPRKPDCNPPVERDAHGILRVKPGCGQ
ncbi:MAG TPA: serine/threonine-protein kinase, partial [Polyangiaceae bacterium]|nr:serine/threonine-protein kinase [Polyangiaceae bacterium]